MPRNVSAVVPKKLFEKDEYSGVRFFVFVRLHDFMDVQKNEREAIIHEEESRFAREGPRRLEVAEEEFQCLSVGDTIEVKYSYYRSVLWGVSGDIRVPW